MVHSFRVREEVWPFRKPGQLRNSIDEKQASARIDLIEDPENSMKNRLLSMSIIDQDNTVIFNQCAGWIVSVDPSAIFATSSTDMALINDYAKHLLPKAKTKECFAALCAGDGSPGYRPCDELRNHLLKMESKHPIRSPEVILAGTDPEGAIPYNEIAVLGKSPDTLETPAVLGVVFGDPEGIDETRHPDCRALRKELRIQAVARKLPVVQLPSRTEKAEVVPGTPHTSGQSDGVSQEVAKLNANIAKLRKIESTNKAASGMIARWERERDELLRRGRARMLEKKETGRERDENAQERRRIGVEEATAEKERD
eukprot:g2234.t1